MQITMSYHLALDCDGVTPRQAQIHGYYGHYTVMAMAISYNWLFLWDYTFYKWG